MSNDIFTLDENNNAAIRTLNVNPGDPEINSPSVFTLDEDGNACVRVTGTGGGGSVDESKVIVKSSTIPTADADSYRKMYIYAGETDATYTHGYIYECQKTSTTYTGTVSFEAATLSGTTVACDGDVFANFLTEAGADPTPIVSGTMTYDSGADGWRLVGKDAEDNTITNFIEYTQDYTDAGFVFTGTPQDGDVVAFTCTVSEASSTYAWVRLDVQPTVDPLPDQTGNAGKFLTTDGTDASWSNKPLVNKTTASSAIAIAPTSASVNNGNYGVSLGDESIAKELGVSVGYSAGSLNSNVKFATCIGYASRVTAIGGYQFGRGTNSEAGTVCFALNTDGNNANWVNYKLLDSDGTIPAARHATLPASDGTYVLKLVISGGVPTLSWVAE